MTRRFLLAALLFLPWSGPARADVEVVFSGGQSIKAREAHYKGDAVFITLPDGTTGSVPASMVTQIRLSADPKQAPPKDAAPAAAPAAVPAPAPPPAARPAAPPLATLEGSILAPPEPAAAAPASAAAAPAPANAPGPAPAPPKEMPRAVLQDAGGSPWVPRDDAAGSRWVPEGVEWAKPSIDPAWAPQSAFGGEDVLAAGRVEWSKPTFDTTWAPQSAFSAGSTWTPTDSFARFGTSLRAGGGGLLAAAGAALLRRCGAQVLPAARGVAALDDPALERFPLPVYAAEGDRPVLFTIAGGTCRKLDGVDAIGAALAALPLRDEWAQLDDLAFAEGVLRLSGPADRVLLAGAGDLARVAARSPGRCTLAAAKRPAALASAYAGVGLPRVERGAERRVVTLYGWNPKGGVVTRERVTIAPDGHLSLETSEVARHVGEHQD